MNYFGKNLKTLRTRNNLSQRQLAHTLGLNQSNIKSYENGAFPNIEKFIRIMNHLEMDPSKFVLLDIEKHFVGWKEGESHMEADGVNIPGPLRQEEESVDLQVQSLGNLSEKEVKELYIKQHQVKEQLLKENLELKIKYIRLLEKKYRCDP